MTSLRPFKSVYKVRRNLEHTYYVYTDSPGLSMTPAHLLYMPAQGDGEFGDIQNMVATTAQRQGNAIEFSRFNMRLDIRTGGSYENQIRLIVFQWLRADYVGSAPILGDILYDTSGYAYLSPLNPETKQAYHILLDKTFQVIPQSSKQCQFYNFTFTPADLKTKIFQFTENTMSGFTAELYKGNLYYIVLSDGAIEKPLVAWSGCFEFMDMQ